MMEEELTYVSTTFQRNGAPAYEKEEESAVIYDQVNVGHENTITAGDALEPRAKAGLRPRLCVLVAVLAIVCVILTAVILALSSHLGAVTSAQEGEIENLTAEIQLLRTDVTHMERKTEELTGEKDRLSWTLGVILQYDVFFVNDHCPQKVCKPCQDSWRPFKSSCYLFHEPSYSYNWRNWEASRSSCKELLADLVVIESLEEQEFINNNTKALNGDGNGYWIGLSNKNTNSMWMWINGSNMTVEYWKAQSTGNKMSCAMTLPTENALANWKEAGCDMKKRWICEKKALIKFD